MRRPRHANTTILARTALGLLLSASALACQGAPEEPAPSPLQAADSVAQVEPDAESDRTARPDATIIARAGDMAVILARYEDDLRRQELLQRPLPPNTLADPTFQRTRVRNILLHELLLEEAKARGITASDTDLIAQAQNYPALQPFADEVGEAFFAAASQGLGLSARLIRFFLERDVLHEALTEALLAEATETEVLWERYQRERNTVTVEFVRILNAPASSTIDSYARTHTSEIQTYYLAHRDRFQRPARAQLRIFRVNLAPDADADAQVQAKERIQDFHRRALGEDLATLARQFSDDPATAKNGGLMKPMTQAQMPRAFEMAPGSLSPIARDDTGYYFFRVESLTPELLRSPESDPILAREIASILIQKAGPAPTIAALAQRVQDALAKSPELPPELEAELKHHVVERLTPPAIGRTEDGRIPTVGLLPKVQKAAFALTSEAPTPSAPIHDGDYVYALRLIERSEASRARFNSEQSVYAEEVREQLKARIVNNHLNTKMPSRIALNLRPIQAKYGLLQRDGSIQRVDPSE